MNEKSSAGLFGHRWQLPILARLQHDGGAKFVTLVNGLGISRSVLQSTMARLAAADLIAHNPGYGHPMRPEYVLTARGREVAPFCSAMLELLDKQHDETLLHSKWAIPILFRMEDQGSRFNALKVALPPVTARALSSELKRLDAGEWVRRVLVANYPPTALYRRAPRARPITGLFEEFRGVIEPLCFP